MDLPLIGSHCALESCRDLDLLPIRCRCDQTFCRHHISPEAHDCPVNLAQIKPNSPFEKLERCSIENCNKPSLDSFVQSSSDTTGRTAANCQKCQKSFCASHRYHSCSVSDAPPAETKNTAAHSLLAKHFSVISANSRPSGARQSPKLPTDPKKRAQMQKVDLMKMRHRAVPGDPKDKPSSVLVDQRLHVKVKLDVGKYASKEGVFWFRKNVGTGRALDQLATHLGIPSSDTSPHQLVKLSTEDPAEQIVLRNDQPLADQVEEGCFIHLVTAS